MLDRFCESRVLAGPTSPATPSAGLPSHDDEQAAETKVDSAPRRRAGRALVIEGEEFRMHHPNAMSSMDSVLFASGKFGWLADRGQRAVIILKERSQVHVIRQGHRMFQ